jgi:hypothetical protein
MKKSDHFAWTPEAQEALDSLKNMLKSPSILTAPVPEEPMLLYIAATTQVVSAALVVEREGPRISVKVQRPVYFMREVLFDSKTRYSQIQKLVYAVLMTKHKLHHYFDTHPITVVSKYPLEGGGGYSEPRSQREDSQMGARVNGAEHLVCTPQCHQVPGAGRLRC